MSSTSSTCSPLQSTGAAAALLSLAVGSLVAGNMMVTSVPRLATLRMCASPPDWRAKP
ncbi:hypothetical protein D3C81_2298870 [compost metagenome]